MTDTLIKEDKKKEKKPYSSDHKLTTIEIQQDIINRLARNESVVKIATSYGVSRQRIDQLKHDHKSIIAASRQELINLLPTALDITKQDLKNGKAIAYRYTYNRKSITEHDLTYKKQIQALISDLFKMLGFFPHTNTSLHIGKLYQDNRTQVKITPEFDRFLNFQEAEQVKVIDQEDSHKSNDNSRT